MIQRYRDHAANERTYLAWVRTGITVMVLGFVVDKFELFLASLGGLLAGKTHVMVKSYGSEYISLALVLLGVLVIVAGALRFFRVRAQIESDAGLQFSGSTLAIVLSLTLVAFGFYLLLYLARII
jgi:putative membrane protein